MKFTKLIFGSVLALRRDLVGQVFDKLVGDGKKWTPEKLDAFCAFPIGVLRILKESPALFTGRALSCLKQPLALEGKEFDWAPVDKFLEDSENLKKSFAVFLKFARGWEEADLLEKEDEVRKAVKAYIIAQCENTLNRPGRATCSVENDRRIH